jgi:Winged helix-turn helix
MPHQPAVILTGDEQTTLETFVHRGKANARTITRARILLKSADGWSTAELVAALDMCPATVINVRRRFTQVGLEAVLHDKVQQHRRTARCKRYRPVRVVSVRCV